MTCRNMKSNFEKLLLAPESVPQAARDHLATCADCRRELSAMQATFALLDDWQAPETNEYFPVRFQAVLREQEANTRAGWLERLRMRMMLVHHPTRPAAAIVLALLLLIGGGTYAGIETFTGQQSVPAPRSATLRELQSLGQNAQVFQQLSAIDQYDNSSNSGNAGSL